MKQKKKAKANSICEELGALLAKSQALLESANPRFSAWEEYSKERSDLFNRLGNLPSLYADGENASDIQDLVAQTFEQDRLLLQRMEKHFANLRDQMSSQPDSRHGHDDPSYQGGQRNSGRGRI